MLIRRAREAPRLARRREPLEPAAQCLLIIGEELRVPTTGYILRRLGVPHLVKQAIPRRGTSFLLALLRLLLQFHHLDVVHLLVPIVNVAHTYCWYNFNRNSYKER